jgi:hypothetical protein
MLPVVLHIALVAGVATLLAFWCGWWMSRLLLPASLKPWGGLLAPLMGYALLLLVGYWCVRDWVGLPVVLAVLVPAAGALNALAWWRTGPPRLTHKPLRHIPLALLLIATFAIGVAPLVSYGYSGIIGENWDIENYLPVARYLERGPVSAIADAPPNPLRDLNASPPAIGLTLGFSIFHGSVDILTGQEALTTFAILLAWLRALGVAGIYVLFRATLGLRGEWALLGAAMSSAGALLLWVGYFNFGMQLAAWPLLGLGLVLGIGSVEDASRRGKAAWPSLLGAAVALAALPVAYYPALTLFVPLAAGLGLAVLLSRGSAANEFAGDVDQSAVNKSESEGPPARTGWLASTRLRMLAASGVLLAIVLLLGIPAIYDYTQGFSFRYGQQLTSLGLFRYVPVTDFAGLTPFELRSDPPVPLLAWVGFGGLLALMLAGLIWGLRRARWLGLVAGALAYILWLRLEDYPYAWMKGGAYAAFPFLGLAAAGAQGIFDRPWPRPLRWSGAVVALALLFFMASSQGQTVAAHMDEPGLFADELPEMLSLRSQIPAGSTVRLTSDPRIQGVKAALPAYLLDHATVIGNTSTGYVPHWENGEEGEVGEYGLLLDEERPEDTGFSRETSGWRAGEYALYGNESDKVKYSRVHRIVWPGEHFTPIAADISPGSPLPSGSYTTSIELAAFEGGMLQHSSLNMKIPPGLSSLSTTVPYNAKQGTGFVNTGSTPIIVRSLRIPPYPPSGTPIKVSPDQAAVVSISASALARAEEKTEGSLITTTLALLLPDSGPATFALDIWDDKRAAHYGWYGLEQLVTDQPRTITLTLDLKSGDMAANDTEGNSVPLGGGLDKMARGDYVARLNVLAGTSMLVAPVDLFSFSVGEDGTISNVAVEQPQLVATTLDRPPVPLEAAVGDDVKLLGYALDRKEARPGDELALTLWWRANKSPLDERSILIHLLDGTGQKRAQADGAPAGGGRPTSQWQQGETVIDKHTLKIPDDLPDGDYKIAVGMYRYPTLELLPLSRNGERLEGNVVHIPLRVER